MSVQLDSGVGHTLRTKYPRTYCSWDSMKQRCNNPNSKEYRYYGGRGINIDPRWVDFDAFLEDMGERPVGKTLDRINNNGPYNRENCRWATRTEQAQNKRKSGGKFGTKRMEITAIGITKNLREWARDTGLGVSTIKRRLEWGWTPERAVFTEPYATRRKPDPFLVKLGLDPL